MHGILGFLVLDFLFIQFESLAFLIYFSFEGLLLIEGIPYEIHLQRSYFFCNVA